MNELTHNYCLDIALNCNLIQLYNLFTKKYTFKDTRLRVMSIYDMKTRYSDVFFLPLALSACDQEIFESVYVNFYR